MIEEAETCQALTPHIIFYPRIMEVALESHYEYGYHGPNGKRRNKNFP
jgi:hypothetical protein